MRRSWYEYNCEEDPVDYYPFDSDGDSSDILKTLSPQVRKRIDALKDLQRQHDQLKAKYLEEKATPEAALEDKYEKLYEPLYTKRYEIVNGVFEVEGFDLDPAEQGKGVPDFWLIALKSNDIFAEEISERDEEALKFLKDIKLCRINDPKGFKLEFFFDTNPFFKNSVLTKTYHLINDKEAENAIGTDIEWYPEKCLTKRIVYPRGHINNSRPRGRFEIPEWKPKVLKTDKTIFRTVDCPSFFDFFKSPEMPEEDSDTGTEPVEQFQHLVEQDYELGSEFQDKIIPQAVLWFTGEAAEDDEVVGMKDDTEEDDEYCKYYGWEKYGDDDDEDEDEDEYGKYYGWEKDVDDEDNQYAKDYKDHKYEKKSSGSKLSSLPSLPSGSSLVQPARSTLNPLAPPFIPNLAYGVKKEFNVTTFDSYPKGDDSSDDECLELERMKKKVCQELNLDSSVSKEKSYKPWP